MTNLRTKSYEDMTFPQKLGNDRHNSSSGRQQNPAFDLTINSLEEIKYVDFLIYFFYYRITPPYYSGRLLNFSDFRRVV